MTASAWMALLPRVVLGAPLLLFFALGLPALLGRPLSERITGRLVSGCFLLAFCAALALAVLMAATDTRQLVVELGSWVRLDEYRFSFTALLDRLSLPLVVLTTALCGVIGVFACRYLHKEPGFTRFFVLLALFAFGMTWTVLAGSLENILAAWELVGLTSALLVGFFYERPNAVRNGLRTWVVYRLTDVGLLTAVVAVYHVHGVSGFPDWMHGVWPAAHYDGGAHAATIIGALVLVSAMGKSALLPFSGWLPRAMEGPTPSSAIFYGALSVHAGAYLLLRLGPVLEQSRALSVAVAALGLLTALHATLVGRVQTDIKSSLAYASLTQVGLIVFEIGLGFRYVPLAHMVGHICLRSLQILRAPSLLHDWHEVEVALGGHPWRTGEHLERLIPGPAQRWLYRFALERAYLDTLLERFVVAPLLRILRAFDRLDRILAAGRRAAPSPPTGTPEAR